MTAHVWDGAVWRDSTDFSTFDGAVWRTATESHVWDGALWREFITACTSPTFTAITCAPEDSLCSAGKFNSCVKWNLSAAVCAGDYIKIETNVNGGSWTTREAAYTPEADFGTPCRKLTYDGSYEANICSDDANTINTQLTYYDIDDTQIDQTSCGTNGIV